MSLDPAVAQVVQSGSMEEFITVLQSVEGKKRELLFLNGDLIAARIGRFGKPQRGDGFWGTVAGQLGCSTQFCRDMYRVSSTFSEGVREEYPEAQWSWFRECAKDHDPAGALNRYEGLSPRDIRELRSGDEGNDAKGWRAAVRISPAQVACLIQYGAVVVPIAFPDGTSGTAEVSRSTGKEDDHARHVEAQVEYARQHREEAGR